MAVPDPPRAQPVSRPPQVQRQDEPSAEEPLLYFLHEPSHLICLRLRLVSSAELGQVAFNLVSAMLAIIHQSRGDIIRVDAYRDERPIWGGSIPKASGARRPTSH